MKLGLYGVHHGSDVEQLARRARLAQDGGLKSLWVGDHIAIPADFGGERPRFEAVVAATYLATVTSRIRLGLADGTGRT